MSTGAHVKRNTKTGRVRALPPLVGIGIILLGFVAATQYLASAMSYQAALGEPLMQAGNVGIYQPFGWIKWFFEFRHIDHPLLDAAFRRAAQFVALAFLIAGAMTLLLRYLATRDLQVETPTLHGSAQWMSREKILKSGLVRTGKGVYIGAWTDPKTGDVEYLRHDGAEHIMALAPTRSGKGVGLVLPTLLGGWNESVVVHDMKGEAWALTAGWRKEEGGNDVLRFDPADSSGTGVKFNPLSEVRLRTEKEVGDVQNLVTMIVDPDGKGLNDHWAKTGHALLVGAVLHVLYAERNKTLQGVAEFLSDPSREFLDTLEVMLSTDHDDTGQAGWMTSDGSATQVHPVVASSARDMLNKADNERSGVLSTAMSFLTLYRDPIVANNTSASEFRIADLMNAARPVSLYLVVRPSDKDRLKPLIRLLMNQIVRGLTEEMKFAGGRSVKGYKHRLLLLIDEFPALGKLEILEEALAFIAGYGIKAYLIIQDKAQLEKHYGKEESVTSNCHIRIAYAPNKIETAEMLSKLIGTTTVVKQNTSYSGTRSRATMNNISTQVQEVSRPLLTADEIMRLKGPTKDGESITDAGEMLIFQAGQEPILGTQILYFQDATFDPRSKVEAPDESDRLQPAALPSPPVSVVAPAAPSAAAAPAEQTPPAEPAADYGHVIEDSESDEDEIQEDEYSSPELPESALIGDHEFAESETTVLVDDGEIELGSEIVIPAEDLIGIELEEDEQPDDEGHEAAEDDPTDDDEQAQTDPLTATEIPKPATVMARSTKAANDPFLAASMAWAAGQKVEAAQAQPDETRRAADSSASTPATSAATAGTATAIQFEQAHADDNPFADFDALMAMTGTDGK